MNPASTFNEKHKERSVSNAKEKKNMDSADEKSSQSGSHTTSPATPTNARTAGKHTGTPTSTVDHTSAAEGN